MDKQEYKILSEEIMSLVATGDFTEAASIADRIDWRKVKSFTMLQKISDLYKINQRLDEALEIIGYAYDRNPNSKSIVYDICELYLEIGDVISALQYMNLYKKMAPNDVGNAILKYKLLDKQEASFEDRIEQLEKIVSMSYQEEWAYQLAYMYHRMGLATRCVECCNQLISWFGQGPFVIKTMELKMLHEKLTPAQQEIYDHRNDVAVELESYEGEEMAPGQDEIVDEEEDFRVKTIDMSKYNTINLQKALAESMRELMGEDTSELMDTSKLNKSMTAPVIDESDNNTVGLNNSEISVNVNDNFSNNITGENNRVVNDLKNEDYYSAENDNFVEGYTDENGNFIAGYTDENGNFIEGYTDENGNFIEGYTDENGNFIAGYTDENGNFIEGYTDENGNFVAGYTDENGNFIADYIEDNSLNKNNIDENSIKPNTVPDKTIQVNFREKNVDIDNADADNPELEDETRFISPNDVINNNITNQVIAKDAILAEEENTPATEKNVFFDDKTGEIIIDAVPLGMLNDLIPGVEFVPHDTGMAVATGAVKALAKETVKDATSTLKLNKEVVDAANAAAKNEKSVKVEKSAAEEIDNHQFDDVLSLDEDGQFKMVVPDKTIVDRQITGQMNLEDVLSQWEKEKEERDNKQKAEIKKHILDKTGEIFVNYDEAKKSGIVAKIKEDQKIQKRVLKNELELKRLDEIPSISTSKNDIQKVDFDATAALNKTYGPNIWDEVDRANAIEAAEGAMISQAILSGASLAETTLDTVDDVANAVTESANIDISNTSAILAPVDEEPTYEGYESEYQEEYSYEEESINEETPAYEEAPSYEEEAVYEEAPAYEEEAVYEEAPAYEEEAVYEEAPIYEDQYSEDEYIEPASLNTEQIYDISSALEDQADKTKAKAIEEIDDSYDVSEEREFSYTEQELFEEFLYSKKMRTQILEAVDIISLAPYVGNAIITGEPSSNVLGLAKALVSEIKMIDANFDASKFTKISGMKMNQKDISGLFMKLTNGALIIEKAGRLTKESLENITKALESLPEGLIVILTDTKKEIDKLLRSYEVIKGYFGARIDILPMNDNALVEYAKKYAYSKEYKIDEEKAVLALHARISELRIGEHNVTTKEVETIIDNAIEHSKKPHLSTFASIIAGKRYDYDDMIILREKDFGA